MKTPCKLIFFGNERLVSGLPATGTPVLKALIKAGYQVVAILSHHSEGQSRSSKPLEVAEVAEQFNIPLFLPARPSDITAELKAFKAEAAVLVAYGRIISKSVIDIFPKGIVNVHPSLLPKYRGPSPIETALLNGDKQTGISIMKLTAGLDEGPIYTQKSCHITPNETKLELSQKLSGLGAELIIQTLPDILNGNLKPIPQKNNGVTYTSLISKQGGKMNLTTHTATEIECMVRAYQGYPKARLMLGGKNVILIKVTVIDNFDDKKLVVKCTSNTFLTIDELIAPSGKTMTGEDFKRGYLKT